MTKIGIDIGKIDKFFKGNYSDTDSLYVNAVFNDDNKEKELKRLLARQFDELLPEDDVDKKNLNHILYRIHYEINTRLSGQKTSLYGNIKKWTLRIAGVLILPLLVYIGIQKYDDAYLKKEAWVEIKAPAWTRARFSLPDGTTGWLNSNSSVKYSGNFYANRHVTLTGEAFFDVFKDKKRPFIVNTNDVTLTVSGTRFNIAAYENENKVEVVLEEGELIFNDKAMTQSYKMNPNDFVIYDKNLKNFSTEIVQPQKYLSWTEGKLVFRNDPLDVIARRIERWYNVDVEVNGSLVEDLRLRATFVDESLEDVLSLLRRSLPIEYIIKNRNINPDGSFPKMKVIIKPKN